MYKVYRFVFQLFWTPPKKLNIPKPQWLIDWINILIHRWGPDPERHPFAHGAPSWCVFFFFSWQVGVFKKPMFWNTFFFLRTVGGRYVWANDVEIHRYYVEIPCVEVQLSRYVYTYKCWAQTSWKVTHDQGSQETFTRQGRKEFWQEYPLWWKSSERSAEDRLGYTVISEAVESLILKKTHDPYGKARGGERFAKELRKGSSWEPLFCPPFTYCISTVDAS